MSMLELDKRMTREQQKQRAVERRAAIAEAILLGKRRAEIAVEHGVSLQIIYQDIKEIREKWRAEAVEAMGTAVGRELALLDADDEAIRAEMANVTDPELRLKFRAALAKVGERRARLLGCEAPRRVEVAGPGGGPVAMSHGHVDLTALLMADPEAAEAAQRLLSRIEAAPAARRA